MVRRSVEVPDGVRRKALAQGDEGRRWLESLSDVIADFEREWSITVGATFSGGTAGYVAAPATVELAVEFARRRREAFNPESAVLVHGDAHPANILEDPTAGDGLFKLVDPAASDRNRRRCSTFQPTRGTRTCPSVTTVSGPDMRCAQGRGTLANR